MRLRVARKRALTPAIAELTLVPEGGGSLPAAEPGAHITVQTPSGAMRRYSLVHPDASPGSYTIAVKREAESRGGSASMHDETEEGTVLPAEDPKNDFPLNDKGPVCLVAGGIGVTPIHAMAQALSAAGRPFRLIYCTRSRAETAYAEELEALCGESMVLHHDEGDPDRAFDFWDAFAEPTAEHVYCCGPAGLMEEVRGVTGHWPEGRIHFEDFKPVDVVRADDRAFTVVMARTGTEVTVPADRSILEALRDGGHATSSSCESGTCGTCKCSYLEGEVDHRDMVLMDDERDSRIMICVSRAMGDRLVLDL